MVSLLMARALMGAVQGLERPILRIERWLEIAAGAKEKQNRHLINVELFVDNDEFRDIAKHQGFRSALGRAEELREANER